MPEPQYEPTCPRCGDAMVRRIRRSDGTPFLGCSRFPQCRGTRQLSPAYASRREPARYSSERQFDDPEGPGLDRFVVVCGAGGLAIGLGFIIVGLNSNPGSYALIGVALIALTALLVLPSPFLPSSFAREAALKLLMLCIFLGVFFVAWGPVSQGLGQYVTNAVMQSVPTAVAPSLGR